MGIGSTMGSVFSGGKTTLSKGVKRGTRRARKIVVDVNDRMEKSFGRHVDQLVEVHYLGKPLTFRYNGAMETITIDVLHREQQEQEIGPPTEKNATAPPKKKKVEETVEKFDSTKRRLDMADVSLSCSCGMTFKTKVPVSEARNGNDNIKRNIDDKDIKQHMRELHTLNVDYVEIKDEVIPERDRIHNFDQKYIRFFRLFPKKTAEVKYLVSYDQDILSEAPQIKFSESSTGSAYLRKQNTLLMFFLFGVVDVFTYIVASASAYPYNPHPQNLVPWYLLIFTIIGAIVAVWMIKLREMGKTMIKNVRLQAAPFYISNRGILPVVMTESVLDPMWDYQSRVMHVDDKSAKEVYHSLTTWSDSQIAELYRAKQLGQVEHELTVINNEIRDIQKLDIEYRNQTSSQSASFQQIAIAVMVTIMAYSLIMFVFGFL